METVATDCLNCGAQLTGEFCASCGQKRPHTDPSLRDFLRETTEELTHWEGKVPQTLKTLLARPGQLTRDFLAGRRARWLPPLRVYIICSLLFFVAKPIIESATGRSFRTAQFSVTNADGSTTMTPEARAEIEKGLPARLFGAERVIRAASSQRELNRAMDATVPRAMFVLLPFFALLTNVAWRKRAPRYPAHLYAALHIHAAWFTALFVSTVASAFLPDAMSFVLGLGALGYIVWYAIRAFKTLYQEAWGRTLVKSTMVGGLYLASLAVTGMVLLAIAMLTL